MAKTATFAFASIRRWWNQMGQIHFPDVDRLLFVTVEARGSSGYRSRAWEVELAHLAEETGPRINVCHYPPGTSKWNKIEQRIFSFITTNVQRRPLAGLRTIIALNSRPLQHRRAEH